MKLITFNINGCRTDKKGVAKFFEKNKEKVDFLLFQEAPSNCVDTMDLKISSLKTFGTMKICKQYNMIITFANLTVINSSYTVKKMSTPLMNNKNIGVANSFIVKINKTKDIRIINVHGVAFPGDKLDNKYRLKQSKLIVEEALKKRIPTIIAGDFNLLPNTESIKIFERSGFINLIKKYKIKNTRNRVAWDRYPKNKKQKYADYIFVSKDIKVKDLDVTYTEISDHLPIKLTFDLR